MIKGKKNPTFIFQIKSKKYFLLFQVQTLGGDLITINRNSDTNKVKIIHAAGESKVKIANIETKFGLVYVIDKPIN